MFQSIGPGELFLIGLVALIVFGPERLPEMARKMGGYIRELRSAASEIKQGLDEEVRQLREPLETVKQDLTKPISEVKKTLSETADVVKQSTEATTSAMKKSVDQVREAGKVQWVGAKPKVGVAPDDSWKGMDDPAPDDVAPADDPMPGEAATVEAAGDPAQEPEAAEERDES